MYRCLRRTKQKAFLWEGFFSYLFPEHQRHVLHIRLDAHIGGADDLAVGHQLLEAVCRPARDARDGENRRIQFVREVQHRIHESAVKIHVGADRLIAPVALVEQFGRKALHALVKLKFLGAPLLDCQFLDVLLEDERTGVGLGVDRVADAVDQTAAVKRLFVEDTREVSGDGIVALPVGNIGHNVGKHVHDLDVRAAVARTFQRAERRCHRRIGIRAG